jgi:hypothetical protein
MSLDAAAVDEQPVGGILTAGKRGKEAFPYTALGPADEAIVQGLLRTVDIARTIGPAAAMLQSMDEAAQDTAIVLARLATHVPRQKRLDPSPLRFGKPKEIRHTTTSRQRQ